VGEEVAAFCFGGEVKLGYDTNRFSGDVFIADCYCAVCAKGRRLVFCAYTAGDPNFPLVAIDLRVGGPLRGLPGGRFFSTAPSAIPS
jgi:hypothetical protein